MAASTACAPCTSLGREPAGMATETWADAAFPAQSPPAEEVSESSQKTAYRGRTDGPPERRRPVERSRLLAPPSNGVARRASSQSSSRTRSLSVSPPLERHPHRAGRRLRALGEGGQGSRARSFSPNPRRRGHHRSGSSQEDRCRGTETHAGKRLQTSKHMPRSRDY